MAGAGAVGQSHPRRCGAAGTCLHCASICLEATRNNKNETEGLERALRVWSVTQMKVGRLQKFSIGCKVPLENELPWKAQPGGITEEMSSGRAGDKRVGEFWLLRAGAATPRPDLRDMRFLISLLIMLPYRRLLEQKGFNSAFPGLAV